MYIYKRSEELAWVGLVAAGVFILQLLAELDPEAVLGDWRTYGIAAASGALRAFAGAILASRR